MTEPGTPIRVLHVDDQPDFAEMAREFLERESDRITIRNASSADDGQELLGEHEFDCVVSDYDMPRTNGIEFLEVVQEGYPICHSFSLQAKGRRK